MKTTNNSNISRDSIIEEAYERCLQEMYHLAQPSIDYFKVKEEALKRFEETCEQTDIINHHYLSEKLYEALIAKYVDAYHLESEFYDDCDLIAGFLDGDGCIRLSKDNYEKLPKISEVIGEENAQKVFDYIEKAKNYYRFDRDAQTFRWGIFNMAPTCNKEMVEKYWEEQGKPIEIKDYDEEEIYDLLYDY